MLNSFPFLSPLHINAASSKLSSTATASTSSPINADALPQFKLTLTEKAKTVTSTSTSGTLCTLVTPSSSPSSPSPEIAGYPFGSHCDYVLDGLGNPVLLMNEDSQHTKFVEASEGQVSLFTQLGNEGGGNQEVSRVSLTGILTPFSGDEEDLDSLKMKYSLAHTYADRVMESPKFKFYRLRVESCYYVGGFGVGAKWVDVEEYGRCEPDILAKESQSICEKINEENEDDLLNVGIHLLSITSITLARLTGIDRLGMDLRVTYKGARSKEYTDEFRIGFRIPIMSTEDAKSETLKIFQEAWEKGEGVEWEVGEEEEEDYKLPVFKFASDALGKS
ncbi:hypothetical protein TL16_g09217 [Triparma laevis f. inornata]|uniref:Uncharacterized protein n=1 Tax=Triparma laevis f. inornata TaxID=1714386 RepID=A0A9W7EKF1_9STRA|nr:hypothetical protein TL16_g09217 [Triparma laevis f. inornata]